eukprot:gene23170-24539_t
MDETIAHLASTVARTGKEGLTPTAMPNVGLYKISQRIDLLPETYRPVVSLILQGEKQLLVGHEVLTYRAGDTFTAALDLPVLGKITQASAERPYLAIRLVLDPDIVSDLLFDMPNDARDPDGKGFGVHPADRDLLDAWSRMLRLIERPDEVRIMAPLLEREIVYRLLRGPQGAVLKQVAAIDPKTLPIRTALALIGGSYASPLKVEEIAQSVGMSGSAFHRRFKAATGMAPLQYQKTLRLYEARRLLLSEMTSASAAAFSPGISANVRYAAHAGNPEWPIGVTGGAVACAVADQGGITSVPIGRVLVDRAPPMQWVTAPLATHGAQPSAACASYDARAAAMSGRFCNAHSPKIRTGSAKDRPMEFLDADTVVIGVPMYNFTCRSALEAWIDRIVIPGDPQTQSDRPRGPGRRQAPRPGRT